MTSRSAAPKNAMSRRHFLHSASLATAALAAGSYALLPAGVFGAVGQGRRRIGPNDKVNLACVGIGNRGADVIRALNATGIANVVALCDTQMGAKHTEAILKEFPNVAQFRDFRQMFDKMGKGFDAVGIATPDHSHFPIAMLAMSQGKGVFVEKPLAHSFRQIELMMAAERRYRVACQMGNQGHSEANYFQFKAWTEAGIIKNVSKITAFMNSPRRWHGMAVDGYLPGEPTPELMDWNCWIATALEHPFNAKYLNGDWRSWYDFGNGALGDWGAHIFDTCHEFLKLGLPTEVEPALEGHSPFIFPQASTLAFRFPKRGALPPVELTWYDGVKNLPPLPAGFGGGVVDPNIPPPTKGAIDTKVNPPGKVIYGEGLTFKGGSHASTLEIIPASAAQDVKLPEVLKSPSNHFMNFLRACRGEEKCRSNFAVAGPLCQAMAIGIIAQRVNAKLAFDPRRKRITNHKAANELLKGAPPRKEWEQFYKL
jgi:predicted dehydrogenase